MAGTACLSKPAGFFRCFKPVEKARGFPDTFCIHLLFHLWDHKEEVVNKPMDRAVANSATGTGFSGVDRMVQ